MVNKPFVTNGQIASKSSFRLGEKMSKLNFSFKKRIEKPAIQAATAIRAFVLNDEDEEPKEVKEFITSIRNNKFEIKSAPVKEEVTVIRVNESRRGDQSDDVEDADYNMVKPEEFGMAMLRGMAKCDDDLVGGKIYEPRQSTGRVGLGFVTQKKRYLPGHD